MRKKDLWEARNAKNLQDFARIRKVGHILVILKQDKFAIQQSLSLPGSSLFLDC